MVFSNFADSKHIKESIKSCRMHKINKTMQKIVELAYKHTLISNQRMPIPNCKSCRYACSVAAAECILLK